MKLLQELFKGALFEQCCPLNKKEPAEGLPPTAIKPGSVCIFFDDFGQAQWTE